MLLVQEIQFWQRIIVRTGILIFQKCFWEILMMARVRFLFDHKIEGRYCYLRALFSHWPEPAAFGGNRNPEESGGFRGKYRNSCPTGIPPKNSSKIRKKQEFLSFLRKIPQENTGKKKSSGILTGTLFWVQKINS